jgi:hypothetical protein
MHSPFDAGLLGKAFPELPGLQTPHDGPAKGSFDQVSPFDGSYRHHAYRRMSAEPDLMLVVRLPREL